MGKGIILLFLSGGNANSNKNANNKGEKSPEYYGIEGKKEEKFLGLNTNDAPVKYLLYCAAKNGDIIQNIVCNVTISAFVCCLSRYIPLSEYKSVSISRSA